MHFEALRASTIPGLLVERATTRPGRVAFRSKELGIWRETTWRALADRVAALALGFAGEYRLGRGETVAIVGDTCPNVRGVLVVDTRALFMYRHPRVRPLADLERPGRGELAAEPDALGRLARSLSPDDPATIIYTSGTTGHPKGAIYRHGPHLAACANIIEHYPILKTGEHRAVAMLPLCHAMGRNLAITMPLLADIVPHYPESVDTFADALYEIQPTFVFTVPRYLQKFAAHLLVGLDQSSWIKRAAYQAAMRVARRALERRWREPLRGVRPDGDGRGARLRPARALSATGRRGSRGAEHEDRAGRGRGDSRDRGGVFRRILARPRCDRGALPRREARDRRRRPMDQPPVAEARRPEKGHPDHRGREEREPLARREPPAREPVHQRGRRVRRGAEVSGGAARGRRRDGGRVGPGARRGAHGLRLAGGPPRGDRAARGRADARERRPRARRAGQGVPASASCARSRAGRRARHAGARG